MPGKVRKLRQAWPTTHPACTRCHYESHNELYCGYVTHGCFGHSGWQYCQVSSIAMSSLPSDDLARVPAPELVLGDIVHINMGCKVPADLRLIDVSSDLKFDRSILTGESNAIPATVENTNLSCKHQLQPLSMRKLMGFVVSHGVSQYRSPGDALCRWRRTGRVRVPRRQDSIWTDRQTSGVRTSWANFAGV